MVQVKGLRELNNILKTLPSATGKAALTRFGKKRLEPMRDTAKARVPVDEAELQESLAISTRQGTHGQRKKRFADKATVEVYMGPDQTQHGHAVAQEMGSINNAPAGYMRGAWDQHNGELLDNITEDLGAAIIGAANRRNRKLARGRG